MSLTRRVFMIALALASMPAVAQTNSESSTSIGVTAIPSGPPRPAAASELAGSWNVTTADGRACMLSFHRGTGPGAGGGATARGCGNTGLADVGNWASTDGGDSITLSKLFVVPVATLRRTGPQRFDGTLSTGTGVTLWR